MISLRHILMTAAACMCIIANAAEKNYDIRDSILTVPAGIVKIDSYQFADNTEIKGIRFESQSTFLSIGDYAFIGCTSLEWIELPESLRDLGEGAFLECKSLRHISIPGQVRKIPRQCFAWCSQLESVKLPSRLADIASQAFAYCEKLKEIEIPNKVTHIGANVFSFCLSLESISLPASIKELESYAFSECVSLKEATLPANPNMLGELIFSGCRNLEKITELSTTPPIFDCNSYLFEENENEMYQKCHLVIPKSSKPTYSKSHCWKLFQNICTR